MLKFRKKEMQFVSPFITSDVVIFCPKGELHRNINCI